MFTFAGGTARQPFLSFDDCHRSRLLTRPMILRLIIAMMSSPAAGINAPSPRCILATSFHSVTKWPWRLVLACAVMLFGLCKSIEAESSRMELNAAVSAITH